MLLSLKSVSSLNELLSLVAVTLFSSQQDAVEQNEQRKKQEEAMREKLLAQEAKQHDPKVQSKCTSTVIHQMFTQC